MLAAVNDLAFSLEGYMWMGTNVVANVAHLIVLRKVPHTPQTLPHALHTPVYATSLCSARYRIRRMRFIRPYTLPHAESLCSAEVPHAPHTLPHPVSMYADHDCMYVDTDAGS